MYTLDYSDNAKKYLKKLDSVNQKRIIYTLERCRIRPFKFVTKVVGSPYFKIRSGDYRIIVDINNSQLIILTIEIGHRKNIYE